MLNQFLSKIAPVQLPERKKKWKQSFQDALSIKECNYIIGYEHD